MSDRIWDWSWKWYDSWVTAKDRESGSSWKIDNQMKVTLLRVHCKKLWQSGEENGKWQQSVRVKSDSKVTWGREHVIFDGSWWRGEEMKEVKARLHEDRLSTESNVINDSVSEVGMRRRKPGRERKKCIIKDWRSNESAWFDIRRSFITRVLWWKLKRRRDKRLKKEWKQRCVSDYNEMKSSWSRTLALKM